MAPRDSLHGRNGENIVCWYCSRNGAEGILMYVQYFTTVRSILCAFALFVHCAIGNIFRTISQWHCQKLEDVKKGRKKSCVRYWQLGGN
jgi:hypothetical protein